VKRDVLFGGGAARAAVACPPARTSADPISRVLGLQRTAGNRATVRALQRLSIDDVWDVVQGPFSPMSGVGLHFAIELAFDQAVALGRARSTVAAIPASFDTQLDDYALANPDDGKILKAARARKPTFRRGGLVPDGAAAMTLDRDIFCGPGEPTVETYIHELVHVWQYGEVGRARFIENLLGSAGAGVLWQLIRGKAVDIMTASRYEKEAYGVECRFKKWAGYKLPDNTCDAQGHMRE
jgi:hypothetical protein